MTSEKICQRVGQRHPELSRDVIRQTVRLVISEMSDSLVRGQRVEIRGLGTFAVRDYPPRTAYNPRTGERLRLGARPLPVFRCGRALFRRLNPHHRR